MIVVAKRTIHTNNFVVQSGKSRQTTFVLTDFYLLWKNLKDFSCAFWWTLIYCKMKSVFFSFLLAIKLIIIWRAKKFPIQIRPAAFFSNISINWAYRHWLTAQIDGICTTAYTAVRVCALRLCALWMFNISIKIDREKKQCANKYNRILLTSRRP